MSSPADAALRHLLPEPIIGVTKSITPIQMGLSGAGVYAVSTERGEYILRVQGREADDAAWAQQLRVLRRAAEHRIAPAVVHVDDAARAVISVRVAGAPLPAALADPSQRGPAITSLMTQLCALHAIDSSGVAESDPVAFARAAWMGQRSRAGFPTWASEVGGALDGIAAVLARDTRRVVGHNDINPSNVLWDGARAWLVDWEVAGLAHPYYDLATLATFLNLDTATAHGLLQMHEQAPLNADAHATFATLRRLIALATGCVFLGLVPDLRVLAASTRGDAPALPDVYARMRAGSLDLQQPSGRAAMGLALLRIGTEPA